MKTIRLLQGPVVHIAGESNPITLAPQVVHKGITIRIDPVGSLPASFWQDGTVDVVVRAFFWLSQKMVQSSDGDYLLVFHLIAFITQNCVQWWF